MVQTDLEKSAKLAASIADWLISFEMALALRDAAHLASLFEDDSHWRDVLAFSGNLRTISGQVAIGAALASTIDAVAPYDIAIDENRAAPRLVARAGRKALEFFIRFRTKLGRGSGVVRLVNEDAGLPLRAWTLLTTLESLDGHEERTGHNRPSGDEVGTGFGEENWLERRVRVLRYKDRDPDVLIVGAGQAGLAAAAALGALGVDALIVDRHERVGDTWRKRYHSLRLHNETWVNHLPYMPFPATWPTYIAKDKLADWFEAYAQSMELNVWTGTDFVSGTYDPDAAHWTARVRRADGTERTMHPQHIVLASGVSGIPVKPALPGLDAFGGTVIHSSAYGDGHLWTDHRAIVIGAGNSGHDVAQDLHGHGASVTMVQRSATIVASKVPSAQLTYSMYAEGLSTDDCDLLTASIPYPILQRGYQLRTIEMQALDNTLLTGLANAGFAVHQGEDETGYQMSYLRRGGGYYLNVGCSDLIIDRKVRVVQNRDIECFETGGARLADGTLVPADLVVMATGYKPQQEVVRILFGNTVADAIGPVWGFDAAGELRNMWRPTAQAGLWFTAGSLLQCRLYARYLALQIKARLAGLGAPFETG